jgi:two-component system sensor histidine kinase GlrK
MTENRPHSTELTAYLSHELRNALACIHQFGNILVDGLAGDLTAEQREYIRIMLENASKIRRVLDSALDGNHGAPQELVKDVKPLSKLET